MTRAQEPSFQTQPIDALRSTTLANATPTFSEKAPSGFLWSYKMIWERLFALVLLLLLLPLFMIIFVAVRLDSKGPTFFLQPRFGKDMTRFNVIKFRTMKSDMSDVTGAHQTQDTDPRITRVGMLLRRTSLDELPQVINVLRGDMALIGPRAHPCGMQVDGELCEHIDPDYHKRHAILPGITGWAQVNGSRGAVKSAESLKARVDLDLSYIRDWSLAKDIQIVIRTLGVMVHGGRGV